MFVVEDDWHADHLGQHESRAEALAELCRLAGLEWNHAPDRCPCTSGRTCGRRYRIVDFDTSPTPWRRIGDEALLDVSAKGAAWLAAGG